GAPSDGSLTLLWVKQPTGMRVDYFDRRCRTRRSRSVYLFIFGAGLALYPRLGVEPLVLVSSKDLWRERFAAAKGHAERWLDNDVEPALWRVKEIRTIEKVCNYVFIRYFPRLRSCCHRIRLVHVLWLWHAVKLASVVLNPLCFVRQH